tara:strand:+ start:989 stop:1267 length:279 start_codon:yes stop_codon:yes gene_type:complete
MKTTFEHLGFHLDIYCKNTFKYLGTIPQHNNTNNRTVGYFGRKLEIVKAQGNKGNKQVDFNGEYITELVPLCGRIVGNRFQTLEQSKAWQIK